MACSVCKHWRTVVLECRKAWSNLWFNFQPTPECTPAAWCIEEDEVLAAISPRGKARPWYLWLERSAAVPLSLRLTIAPTCPRTEQKLRKLLFLLEPHMSRIQRVTLSLESVHLAVLIVSLFSKVRLDRLEINVPQSPRIPRHFRGIFGIDSPVEGYGMKYFWNFSPLVSYLVCRECIPNSLRSNGEILATPGHLRCLDISTVTICPNELLSVLSSCINLCILQLGNIEDVSKYSSSSPVVEVVTLDALQDLSVTTISSTYCCVLLQALKAPQLTKFKISNCGLAELKECIDKGIKTYDAMAKFGTIIAAFLEPSPLITTLHISDSPLPDRYLVGALKQLPHLNELRLTAVLVGAPAFRALTSLTECLGAGQDHIKKAVCPSLQRLQVLRCDLLDGSLLIDLVKARNGPRSTTLPITSLLVEECKKVDQRCLRDIQKIDPKRLHIIK